MGWPRVSRIFAFLLRLAFGGGSVGTGIKPFGLAGISKSDIGVVGVPLEKSKVEQALAVYKFLK